MEVALSESGEQEIRVEFRVERARKQRPRFALG